MKQLFLSKTAEEDLISIYKYIARESQNIKIARDFTNKLYQKCEDLANSPFTIGREREDLLPNMRSYAYKNYAIFFKINGEILEVINILEGHRDMGSHFSIP